MKWFAPCPTQTRLQRDDKAGRNSRLPNPQERPMLPSRAQHTQADGRCGRAARVARSTGGNVKVSHKARMPKKTEGT